jgi:hypothetical protein
MLAGEAKAPPRVLPFVEVVTSAAHSAYDVEKKGKR